MKNLNKTNLILIAIIIVLIITLIAILNTSYEITIEGITYKQKIIDFLIGLD